MTGKEAIGLQDLVDYLLLRRWTQMPPFLGTRAFTGLSPQGHSQRLETRAGDVRQPVHR